MKKAKNFGRELAAVRKERGYPSAFKFFKAAGGSKGLGLAFVSYWDIERGKKLPKSWRLRSIIAALGLGGGDPRARALVRAYFTELAGSGDLVDMLAAPPTPAPSAGLAEEAATRIMDRARRHYTLEQWAAIASGQTSYLCNFYLKNTPGPVPLAELAAALRRTPAEVKKSLKILADAKVIKLNGDSAENPLARVFVEAPPDTPASAAIKARMRGHLAGWLKTLERSDVRRMTIRMPRAAMEAYKPHLKKAVDLCMFAGEDDPGAEGSAVYLVDAGVYELFPKE